MSIKFNMYLDGESESKGTTSERDNRLLWRHVSCALPDVEVELFRVWRKPGTDRGWKANFARTIKMHWRSVGEARKETTAFNGESVRVHTGMQRWSSRSGAIAVSWRVVH